MHCLKRLLCLVALTLIWAPGGHAAEGDLRTYAVISLIGDQISIVGHQDAVGSHTDTNKKETITLDGHVLDSVAMKAVSDAIRRLDAPATVVLLAASDPKLYEMQDKLFDRNNGLTPLVDSLKGTLQNQHATHLILITKHRDDAALRLSAGYIGSGRIEGVGFYLDASYAYRGLPAAKGFLAPFAYLKITLVDVKDMTVIREQVAENSYTVGTVRAKGSLNPWDAMTSKEKVAAMRTVINRAIANAMPEVIAAK